MTLTITAQPLTHADFAPYGDVLTCDGSPDRMINQGLCGRWNDRARLDFGPGGRAGISMFRAEPRALPFSLQMVERHPEGSQAFIPMANCPYLVVVAADNGGQPSEIKAFLASGAQGVNILRDTWHGVLCPLAAPGLFAVMDRIGDTANLQEHWLDQPVVITA